MTRAALQVLAERELRFTMVTKGITVVRDIDLLGRTGVHVQISLNTVDADAIARWEPGAASPDERLRALHQLWEAGVTARLQISPWIPGISDIAAILERVDPGILVTTTPLRLPYYLTRAANAYGLTQAEINDAFRREYERVGPREGLLWSRLPALDGSPPRIEDNFGHQVVTDWTPGPRTEIRAPCYENSSPSTSV